MGKIYCTECGIELDDSMNFCSNCGTPVEDETETPISNEVKEGDDTYSNEHSVKIKEKPEKASNSKYSTASKVFLGLAVVCVILFLGIVFLGNATTDYSDDADVSVDAVEELSPSFTDTIYGINFQIPEGYETFDGTDNQNMGTSITYDRSYMGPDASVIRISVSTTQGNFYWDLSQNRAYDDVDKTINGHDGILDAGGGFKYITDGKLVIINGANEQQLESIIIE